MKLGLFNGGLSTRLAPHLIQINEGVVYKNIDPASGILEPMKKDVYERDCSDIVYNFKDRWIFRDKGWFTEYQDQLFYSDENELYYIESDFHFNIAGIKPPTKPLSVVSQYEKPKFTASNLNVLTDLINFSYSVSYAADSISTLVDDTLLVLLEFIYGSEHFFYYVNITTKTGNSFTLTVNTADKWNSLNIYIEREGKKELYDTIAKDANNNFIWTYNGTATPISTSDFKFLYAGKKYKLRIGVNIGNNYILSDEITVTYKNQPTKIEVLGYTSDVTLFCYIDGVWRDISVPSDHIVPPYFYNNKLLDSNDYMEGTYQYCYTYYDSKTGRESQPSPYSEEIEVVGQADITGFEYSDFADKIRLYRIGGNLVAMSLVTELDINTTSYSDVLGDSQIDGEILDSQDNGYPPSGLKYLISSYNMLFGAIGNTLYFSVPDRPWAWSEYNYIQLEYDITGLAIVSTGILVFTYYYTYLLTGTSPETFSLYPLDMSQGCINHRSINYIQGQAIWASTDGICISNGGPATVLTLPKLGKVNLSEAKNSAVFDSKYYLYPYIVDFRFGSPVIIEMENNYSSYFVYKDILYGALNKKLYRISEDGNFTMHYKSPVLLDGDYSMIKNYKVFYVYSEGDITLTIYIDNKAVITKKLREGFNEIKIPQQYRLGYSCQFEVVGTGKLYEIEYKVEGRQNGR